MRARLQQEILNSNVIAHHQHTKGHIYLLQLTQNNTTTNLNDTTATIIKFLHNNTATTTQYKTHINNRCKPRNKTNKWPNKLITDIHVCAHNQYNNKLHQQQRTKYHNDHIDS